MGHRAPHKPALAVCQAGLRLTDERLVGHVLIDPNEVGLIALRGLAFGGKAPDRPAVHQFDLVDVAGVLQHPGDVLDHPGRDKRRGWLALGLVITRADRTPLTSLLVPYDPKSSSLQQDWIDHKTNVGPVPTNNGQVAIPLRILPMRILPRGGPGCFHCDCEGLPASVATKNDPLARRACVELLLVGHGLI